jgi:ketosteroid isomerase-like protein/Tol biopolymer transport system component
MKKTISIVLVMTLSLVMEVAKADFTFGEPMSLGPIVNSSTSDGTPSISADGLELYFLSLRPGGLGYGDIWVTKRASIDDDWGNPVNLGPPVNSSSWELCPYISRDGLTLYFSSLRPGGYGGDDLYVVTRATKEDDWNSAVNLGPVVNSSAYDFGTCLSDDGLEFYFAAWDRPGGHGELDLWVTTRETTNDDWGRPVNLGPTVNSSASEGYPSILTDGLTLFFSDHPISATSRPGGYGGTDIWVTTRTTKSDPWGQPVNLGPAINSSSNEDSPSISVDGSTLYFQSGQPGAGGTWDLWQVEILPVVDFDGNGKMDSADMNIMVDNWHTDEPLCDIGPTPLGDGIVDDQDMLVLVDYLTKEKVDVEADIAAIDEVLMQYGVASSTGDLELYMSLHTNDIVKMPPDAPATYGKEQLRAGTKFFFDNFTVEGSSYPEETQVDGDMGFTRGNYTLTITPKAGGEPILVDGKYLTLCRRQADGSWKISHDCYNSNVPPAQ